MHAAWATSRRIGSDCVLGYDLVAITEMCWDRSHDWSAVMDGYKLFRRIDQEGKVVVWPFILKTVLMLKTLGLGMIKLSVYG